MNIKNLFYTFRAISVELDIFHSPYERINFMFDLNLLFLLEAQAYNLTILVV
jgi:hypothetical protein